MTPRIAPRPEPYPDPVAHDLQRLMPPGHAPILLFTTVANNPRVLRRLRRGGLLDPGSITPRDRELVILRTTALCDSEYEWGVHVAFFAERVGLGPTIVAATRCGSADDSIWTAEQAILIRLCDELHETRSTSAALFDDLRVHWTDEQIIELVMLAGQYQAISMVTNALALPNEPGAARFPAP